MPRKRYSKGERVDMRQGGRVALARGKSPRKRKTVTKKPIQQDEIQVRETGSPQPRRPVTPAPKKKSFFQPIFPKTKTKETPPKKKVKPKPVAPKKPKTKVKKAPVDKSDLVRRTSPTTPPAVVDPNISTPPKTKTKVQQPKPKPRPKVKAPVQQPRPKVKAPVQQQPQQQFKKDPAPTKENKGNEQMARQRKKQIPQEEAFTGINQAPQGVSVSQQQAVPLGDPRVSTGGRKGVDAPRTPEELERLEQLSYVAGRTPTTAQQQSQAQVEAGDIQTDITPEQRRAAQAALRAETGGRGRGLGMPGGAYTPPAVVQQGTEDSGVTGGYGIGTAQTPASAGFTGGRTPEEINAARAIIEGAARGELPAGVTIPQPAMVDTGIAATTMEMDPTRQAQAAAVLDPGQRIGYDAVTGEAVTGVTPEEFEAGRYTAQRIADQAPVIDAQTGEWNPETIQGMQDQALTQAAEGVDFSSEQLIRGMTQRVVGRLSPQAKAKAVKVAGTDLPKVLRAKKQLRRAGLTEDQINALGNDPEALEAELMNYTEEQRGMIAGLPDEALVSTQLNALLDGIESGEIPNFARPAVAAVEQMLAQRGMSVSTVGRDALVNAIIQSAIPLAQSNAQSIKESVLQQRTIEAQAEQMNAQMAQQRAITNSERVFNLNMAQFNADQQRALSNSKFLQTTSLTEVANDQQAAIQEAASLAQLDVANLDARTKLKALNAQTLLNRDMADLNNRQQAEVLTSQMRQQALLSDQAAMNAAAQFNATSENQTNQFMASMAANMEQFNKTQQNAMKQFNVTQVNQARAAEEAAELEVARLDAQLSTQIDQFNAQQEFAREQFNTQNAQAIEQSNVAWRRQSNTVNTAAINAVNQQNAQNAFGLSTQAMSFLWQELRDQMDYSFRAWDNDQQRKASLMVAALGNEGASYEGKNWSQNLQGMTSILNNFLGGSGGG